MPRHRARPAELHSVFERAFHEERRALLGWVGGLAALAVVMLAIYPTVRDNQQISKLIEAYPKALRTMFGISDYTSGAGYLRAEVFSLMAPLLIVVFAILWGGDVIAGEEERRTIDLLLANPVSRRRILLEKWAAVMLGITIATWGLGLLIGLGAPVVGLHVAWSSLASVVVATMLLGMLYATLALAVGAATGRRGLARGVVTLLAVAAYLVSSLAEIGPVAPPDPPTLAVVPRTRCGPPGLGIPAGTSPGARGGDPRDHRRSRRRLRKAGPGGVTRWTGPAVTRRSLRPDHLGRYLCRPSSIAFTSRSSTATTR